jgi:hypothetical protein
MFVDTVIMMMVMVFDGDGHRSTAQPAQRLRKRSTRVHLAHALNL